jgi:mono/diheme cytochrome c family protein
MKRSATNITWLGGLAFVLLLLGSLAGGGCQTRPAEAAAENDGDAVASPQARIDRGKYLVNGVGCNDCHTPLKMGEPHSRSEHRAGNLDGRNVH